MSAGRFAGRVAMVTGAGSGIGRATALRFASDGARVACLDVDAKAAADTVASLDGEAVALACDVADADSVTQAVGAVVAELGRIDVLANVAGIGQSQRFDDLTPEVWDRTLAVNLTGTYLTCRAALPHLERTDGCIVNVASVAGLSGIAFAAAYAASKGGVVALSRALAVELSDRGVRVRCVCPAGVDTPMVERFRLPAGAVVPDGARRDPGRSRQLLPAAEVAAVMADVAAGHGSDDHAVVVVDQTGQVHARP